MESLSRELKEDLKNTSEKLGFFYPVLKGSDGKIIDGKHRLSANPNWPTKKLPYKADSLQGVLARGLSNIVRRGMHVGEIEQWLDDLEQAAIRERGKPLTYEEICNLTGMSKNWVLKYLPAAYKIPIKVAAGKTAAVKRKEKSGPRRVPEPEIVAEPSVSSETFSETFPPPSKVEPKFNVCNLDEMLWNVMQNLRELRKNDINCERCRLADKCKEWIKNELKELDRKVGKLKP